MSDQASHVAREAKSLQQSLKDVLNTRDPWDRDVEFQRRSLRRPYLRLLLIHPYAKESKDAETHLWMQTSYAFISKYKQRLATLEQSIQPAFRHQQRSSGPGPVEYRKLLQRFRQFLADEEKFWTELVVRLGRSFPLVEAQTALRDLGISTTNDDASGNSGGTPNVRNHFQFPHEDSTVSLVPKTAADRDGRLAIVSKALICLGDIARYRELYNESKGRPKAGQEDNGPLRSRNKSRRGGGAGGLEDIPRMRNYEKAQQCYEHARLLLPYDGNASHQLAILSSYQRDAFLSLFHYYRALCVRQPYDTASENMITVLNKALDLWKARIKREREREKDHDDEQTTANVPPIIRINAFKEKVVVLHALWRLGVDKMDLVSPGHDQNVCKDFEALVSERHLPIEMVSKPIVLSQGALYKYRMVRDSDLASNNTRSGSEISSPAPSATAMEMRIFMHVLALHRILMEIGVRELAEPPPKDADSENDLAQRITAAFRRTLPALRIAGKWLKANYKYVMQNETAMISTNTKQDQLEGRSPAVAQFWDTYARFFCALSRAFPMKRLPSLKAPLEEDVEMRGFLPLRKMMGETRSPHVLESAEGMALSQTREEVHPNEEQLMRISDLLLDARDIVEMENSPIALYGNRFVLKGIEAVKVRGSESALVQHQLLTEIRDNFSGIPELDEDARTEATDDPVGDAFRQVLNGSEESDEEIVWDPRVTISPVVPSPPSSQSPLTPVKLSPTGPRTLSPTQNQHVSSFAPTPTTAQDLLNNVMGLPRTSSNLGNVRTPPESYAAQPQLLFGSGPPNKPGHSIWSTSLDDQSFKFTGAGAVSHSGHGYQSQPQPTQPSQSQVPGSQLQSQDNSQSIWTSSYDSRQNSQSHLVSELPSAPFASQPHFATVPSSHQRAPSMSALPNSQGSDRRNQYAPDPYRYSYQQHPIQRPIAAPTSFPPMYPHSPVTPHLRPELIYGSGPPQGYHHNRQLSYNDPRLGQTFSPPSLSQGWGNNG